MGAQQPTFDVVSIRPNNALDRSGMISSPAAGQFHISNLPARAIVNYAYDLRDLELVDAPEWTRTERFDLAATYAGNAPRTSDEVHRMLQAALADRFQLRVHRETRELPIYRLTKAREDGRLGPQLQSSDVDCAQWLADKKPQFIGTPPIGPTGARPACLMVAQRAFIVAGTKPLPQLALALESIVGRRVVDATGLPGNFDLVLQWTPTPGLDGTSTAASSDDTLSVFTALQEQLGLKLEPARGPVDVLVVDHIERPTEN